MTCKVKPVYLGTWSFTDNIWICEFREEACSSIDWSRRESNVYLFSAPANDYFCHYNAWDKLLKEREDVDVLVICFENLKKVNEQNCVNLQSWQKLELHSSL